MLQKKVQRRECWADLEDLYLESEDLEQDLEENYTFEVHAFEGFRRLEIERGDVRRDNDRTKRIRRERTKWAVKTTKSKVIRRQRTDLTDAEHSAKHELSLEEMTTLSFSKVRCRPPHSGALALTLSQLACPFCSATPASRRSTAKRSASTALTTTPRRRTARRPATTAVSCALASTRSWRPARAP
jgi:hypothetical protein